MKKIIPVIILVLLLSSCKKVNEIDAIRKKLSNLVSYSAISTITIYSDKGTSEYTIKQAYLEPDKIKLETILPEYLKGKTIIKEGKGWRIYHPLIDNSICVDELKEDDAFIYLGIIQRDMISLEGMEYKKVSKNGNGYITLNFKIPNGNEYRSSAILYINREEYIPQFMEILDNEGVVRVIINYSNFQYNAELDKAIFK